MTALEVAAGDGDTVTKTATEAKIEKMTEKVKQKKNTERMEELKDLEEDGEDDENKKGMCGQRSLKTKVVQWIAIISVFMNGAAIGVQWFAPTVILAALFAIVIAPIVIALQIKLEASDTMTQVLNDLRSDVNRLQDENEKLEASINVMDEEVTKLKEQESRLGEITSAQGTTVESFVGLVKENKELLRKEKLIVRQETAQLLSSVVINCDGDCSGTFDEKESRILALKLKALPGVKLNEEKFYQSLRDTDGSMGALLKMVNRIVLDDDSDQVFDIESG
mmetsp:Transcript_3497/g.4643  ORF Transcript_3497/g.4643 Transcript_3497/m.4643 type:complete len:279 (-) Transcript_3497:214-1050(-)